MKQSTDNITEVATHTLSMFWFTMMLFNMNDVWVVSYCLLMGILLVFLGMFW